MENVNGADITSPRNRWIKLARSLHRRRVRYRERAILVEGIRPVQELLNAGVSTQAVLISESLDSASRVLMSSNAAALDVSVFSVEASVFELASDTETPQGVLAICEMPDTSFSPPGQANPLLLIIDQVRDPGNMGTLLRSALGANVSRVLIGPNSADPFSPKVIRAGAGSHFRLAISMLNWEDPPVLLETCPIYVAEADAELAYDEIDWTGPSAIVIGNETSGVSSDAFARAHGRVGIPLANSLESLNAGVAGSVILFEAWRQKRRA